MKHHRSILLLLALLPVSCTSDSGTGAATKPATVKPLSQRLEESNGYKQDADGNWLPTNDKRSAFEKKDASPYFNGEFGRKNFKTRQFAEKPWWGNKEYGRKAYSGNTDGSRFAQSSRLDDLAAREGDRSADIPDTYQTDEYATNAARESRAGKLAKPSDTETEIRRRVFPQPEIVDWKEQRSLSLEQSKGILGR